MMAKKSKPEVEESSLGGQFEGEFGDRPRILAEIAEFKGEYLGLAPNSLTSLRNKNLCILVCPEERTDNRQQTPEAGDPKFETWNLELETWNAREARSDGS